MVANVESATAERPSAAKSRRGIGRSVGRRIGDRLTDRWRITLLAAAALASIAVFLTIGVTANWDYILPRRLETVATMGVVSVAIAMSTVLFHTITANRILTPSIMGFDSLYLLIQTLGVFTLGISAMASVDPVLKFGLETVLMVGLSLVLYRWLLLDTRRSLHVLVLVGVIVGTLLRSVSSLLQRIMSPEQFIVLQDAFFADFTGAEPVLLIAGAVVIGGCSLVIWRLRRDLDVVALGRPTAVGLGVDHRRMTMWALVLVAVLVSIATALVGPTTFFGLLVAHLAYQLLRSQRHALVVPAAALCALIALIGGQVVFERVLGFEGSLSIVVEFLGGIVFILLLCRKASR